MSSLDNLARRPGESASSAQATEHPAQSWPQGVSRVAAMRISDVLAALKIEFPAVTHSKLRFLEEQGFINPVRTASGYRQYSAADLERLRFVLTEQRDRYLPLKVIKEKLEALDRGLLDSQTLVGPRVITTEGQTGAQALVRELSDLSVAADVSHEFIEELLKAGVLRPHISASTDADYAAFAELDLQIVKLAKELAPYGIDWRHLRTMRAAADRTISLIEQSVMHIEGKNTSEARGRASSSRAELSEIFGRLHTVWLRDGIAELDQ